jgi:hypothetical protein
MVAGTQEAESSIRLTAGNAAACDFLPGRSFVWIVIRAIATFTASPGVGAEAGDTAIRCRSAPAIFEPSQ